MGRSTGFEPEPTKENGAQHHPTGTTGWEYARSGQALIGLSLAYEKICRPEPGLWPFIGLFFWSGLA
ncbi:hypothetical protein MTR_5g018840 [Medicago truncatula]|uniref:Uncharacterized protein n=1 Tax=Medicago truncatula TaxID=3880 RepID=G7KAR7_MEDTR|nr:hypothetical protein MTR_5g018840 [Medicago truncatula]